MTASSRVLLRSTMLPLLLAGCVPEAPPTALEILEGTTWDGELIDCADGEGLDGELVNGVKAYVERRDGPWHICVQDPHTFWGGNTTCWVDQSEWGGGTDTGSELNSPFGLSAWTVVSPAGWEGRLVLEVPDGGAREPHLVVAVRDDVGGCGVFVGRPEVAWD